MVDEKLAKPVHPPYEGPPDWYEDVCWVCGTPGKFVRDRVSLSESYRCSKCQGALRYQGQARAVVRAFALHGARSIAALVSEPEFRRLRIFEPDGSGHFGRRFSRLDGYLPSTYAPDAQPGEKRDGVSCEDLMRLSFESMSIDLVLTSDVFEHVRHPYVGFSEVFRVLRPGGMHIFTIPVRWPMRDRTVPRVDVSGADDVFLLPPVYHHCEKNLVYNDFGHDLLAALDEIGFVTDPMLFASTSETTSSHVTFCCTRPRGTAGNRTKP